MNKAFLFAGISVLGAVGLWLMLRLKVTYSSTSHGPCTRTIVLFPLSSLLSDPLSVGTHLFHVPQQANDSLGGCKGLQNVTTGSFNCGRQ